MITFYSVTTDERYHRESFVFFHSAPDFKEFEHLLRQMTM